MDLRDGWQIEGNNLQKFKEACEKMSEDTVFMTTRFKDVNFLSYIGNTIDKEGNPATKWAVLSKESLEEFNISGNITKHATLLGNYIDKELLKENIENVSVILQNRDTGRIYLISKLAFVTMCQRLKLNSEYSSIPSLSRDIAFAQNAIYEGEKNNSAILVTRTDEEVYKIFSFLSKEYIIYPMKNLADIAERILSTKWCGKSELTGWRINHSTTEVQIEFIEIAQGLQDRYNLPIKIIPGILLRTSDIGSASLAAISTVRAETSYRYIILNEYSRRHIGNISDNTEFLISSCNQLIREMYIYPEKLYRLKSETIGGDIDINTEEGRSKNMWQILKHIDRIGSRLGLMSTQRSNTLLGQKRSREIMEMIQKEITPDKHYTLCDICLSFTTLPDLIDITPAKLKNAQALCAKAVDIPLQKTQKDKDDKKVTA